MSDFDRLSDSEKTLLKIKLDGYLEAAVQAARLRNIGLLEALSVTAAASFAKLRPTPSIVKTPMRSGRLQSSKFTAS